jgi:hypothetical protein
MKRFYTVLLISFFIAAAGPLTPHSQSAAAAQCSCCASSAQSCPCGCTDKQDALQRMDLMKFGVCTCAVNEAAGTPVKLHESFTPVKNDTLLTIDRRFAKHILTQNGFNIPLALNASFISSVPLFLRNSSFLL